MYKIYAIFSKESIKKMKGIRGKMATQAGHAFLHSYWDAEERFPDQAKAYRVSGHARKITLIADTDEQLLAYYEKYKKFFPVTKVVDCGFTVFDEPTLTCIGIGPIHDEEVPKDIKKLKLFC